MSKLVKVEGVGMVEFPDSMSEEDIKKVLDDAYKQREPSTVAGSAAGGFIREVGPTAAFAAAAPKGARIGAAIGGAIPGLGETGIPEVAGAVIGGLATGTAAAYGAKKAQTALADLVAPESIFGSKMEGQQAIEHPWAVSIGSLMSGLPTFKLSPGTIFKEPVKALVPAGLGAAIGIADPLLHGQRPTAEGVAEGAAFGLLYGRPRFGPESIIPRRYTPEQLAILRTAKRNAPLAPATAAALTKEVRETPPAENLVLEGQAQKAPQKKEATGASEIREKTPAGGKQAQELEQGEKERVRVRNAPAQVRVEAEPGEVGEPVAAPSDMLLRPALEVKKGETYYTGKTHSEAVGHARKAGENVPDENEDMRGFLTRSGHFVDRLKAKDIFEKATGQKIEREEGLHSEDLIAHPELGVEMLMHEGGKVGPAADPAEVAYLKAERESIDAAAEANKTAGLPSEVTVGDVGGTGDPFARIGEHEVARPAGNGKGIVVNMQQLRKQMARMEPDQRQRFLNSLFAEEGIHAKARTVVPDSDAAALWRGLTNPERSLVESSYFGKDVDPEVRAKYSDAQMGHEYLRRTMQRLMRMDVREVAEAHAKGEGWLKESVINAIERVIQWFRTRLPGTTNELLQGMINKLQQNVQAAKGEGVTPAAFAKERETTPGTFQDIEKYGLLESDKRLIEAIRTGTKPVGLLTEADTEYARGQGFDIEALVRQAGLARDDRGFIYRDTDEGRAALKKARDLDDAFQRGAAGPDFQEQFGKALGYTDQDIEEFKTRSNYINAIGAEAKERFEKRQKSKLAELADNIKNAQRNQRFVQDRIAQGLAVHPSERVTPREALTKAWSDYFDFHEQNPSAYLKPDEKDALVQLIMESEDDVKTYQQELARALAAPASNITDKHIDEIQGRIYEIKEWIDKANGWLEQSGGAELEFPAAVDKPSRRFIEDSEDPRIQYLITRDTTGEDPNLPIRTTEFELDPKTEEWTPVGHALWRNEREAQNYIQTEGRTVRYPPGKEVGSGAGTPVTFRETPYFSEEYPFAYAKGGEGEKLPGFEDLITGKPSSAAPKYQKEQTAVTIPTEAGRPGAEKAGAAPQITARQLFGGPDPVKEPGILQGYLAGSVRLDKEFYAEGGKETKAPTPNFDDFSDWTRRNYGPVPDSKLRDQWQDAVWSEVLHAGPDKLEAWRKALGLEGKEPLRKGQQRRGIGVRGIAEEVTQQEAKEVAAGRGKAKVFERTAKMEEQAQELERSGIALENKALAESDEGKAKDLAVEAESAYARAKSIRNKADALNRLVRSASIQGAPKSEVKTLTEERRARGTQQYRRTVQSAIARKLIEESAPQLTQLERKHIGTEDVDFSNTKTGIGAFYSIPAHESTSPTMLREIFKDQARVSEKYPVSVTRRVAVLLNKRTGEVEMVSAYPHGRSGIMVVEPGKAGIADRPNRSLDTMLGKYRPIYSTLLREPVQNFHEHYDSVRDFNERFGDEAQEMARQYELGEFAGEGEPIESPIEGTEGLRGEGGGVQGKFAAEGRAVMGLGKGELERAQYTPMTASEAGSVLDSILDEVGTVESPEDMRAAIEGLADLASRRGLRGMHRTAISALKKAADRMAEVYKDVPNFTPEMAYSEALNEFYHSIKTAESYEDFVSSALGKFTKPTTEISTGITPAVPGAGAGAKGIERELTMRSRVPPTVVRPEQLPAGEQPVVKTEAPPVPTATPGPQKPTEFLPEQVAAAKEPFATEPPPTFGTEIPTTETPVGGAKFAPEASRGAFAGAPKFLPYEEGWPNAPSAFYKQAQDVKQRALDEMAQTAAKIQAAATRHSTTEDIFRQADGFENEARAYSFSSGNAVRAASMTELPAETLAKSRLAPSRIKAVREGQAAAMEAREGAMPVLASMTFISKTGVTVPIYKKLEAYERAAQRGIQKAEAMIASGGWRDRIVGRKWKEAAERLLKGVNYAQKEWIHPAEKDDAGNLKWAQHPMTRTVSAVRQEFRDEIDWENANGFNVTEREAYMPGLYEGEFWNDNAITFGQMRILGKQYRKPKTFQNYYEAIAAGPYIPASYDPADLVQHRVAAGRHATARYMWADALKGMKDPVSGKPVAINPVPEFGPQEVGGYIEIPGQREGETIRKPVSSMVVTDPETGLQAPAIGITKWKSPDREYELVKIDNKSVGKPIAVREGYLKAVKAAMMESDVPNSPVGAGMLRLTGILKHGVLLALDTFHPGRLFQYSIAGSGKLPRAGGGFSAIAYRPEDIPKAVKAGILTQKSADWAIAPIKVLDRGRIITMTRQDLAKRMVAAGLNTTKVSDALYKDAVASIPGLGKWWHKTVGPVNKLVFDYMVPGFATEAAVRNIEKLNKQRPDVPLDTLIKDVSRDVNFIYGSLGRQGVFKNPTWRDLAQIFLLAPMWQEGLIQKELRAYGRAPAMLESLARTGLSKAGIPVDTKNLISQKLTGRQGLPAAGLIGRTVGGGLFGYFMLTQLMNLAFRHKFTWQNDEEGHKMDAALDVGDNETVWLSPMSVFAEVAHDVIRLGETKPTTWDAIMQAGANKLGPVGRMARVLTSGQTPTGQRITSTPGVLGTAASQLAVAPISVGTPVAAGLHAVAPGLAPAVTTSQLWQRMLGSVGIKTNVGETAYQQMLRKAQKFMDENRLKKETGWEQVQTDEPSYSKLRSALRKDDRHETKNQLDALLKTHSVDQIWKAMQAWGRRPFTGSNQWEKFFVADLTPGEQDIYWRSNLERQEILEKFIAALADAGH